MFLNILKSSIVTLGLILFISPIYGQEVTAAGAYNEGLGMLKSKDYDNGLVKMEEALSLAEAAGNDQIIGLAKKNGAIAAYNLGNAKRKAGDQDAAMALYNKGIAMNPDYSSNYEGVARSQEAKGEKVTAVKSYILAAQKGDAEGKADRAASRYKKAETLIGKTYVAKDYAMAIEMAQAYTTSAPDNADVYYYLSRSLGSTDKFEEGVTAMKKAMEISGDSAPDKFIFYLAEQLEKSGSATEAAAMYKKVTEDKYKAQAEYRASQLEK